MLFQAPPHVEPVEQGNVVYEDITPIGVQQPELFMELDHNVAYEVNTDALKLSQNLANERP